MEIPYAEDRIRAIARSYAESPERNDSVTGQRFTARLNTAVRHELKLNGTIASEEQSIRVLVQRQEMTGAGWSWASRYEVNDVVRYARGEQEHWNRGESVWKGC